MIQKLLCYLKFHKWKSYSLQPGAVRSCFWCPKKQKVELTYRGSGSAPLEVWEDVL